MFPLKVAVLRSVDQFYESIVCMREIEVVGRCGVSSVKCTMQVAVMDNSERWMCKRTLAEMAVNMVGVA